MGRWDIAMFKFRPKSVATLSTLTLLLLTIAAFGSRIVWYFDLLTLFHLPYVIWAAVSLAFWTGARRWRWAAAALILLLLNGARVLPYIPKTATSIEGETLRIYLHNVYYGNQNLPTIRADVDKYNPDIVLLMEYSDAIQQEIEQEFDDYPYRLIRPSRFAMGNALFSKYPLANSLITQNRETTRIAIFQTDVQWHGQSFSLVAGHTLPPQPKWGALHRLQIETIGEIVATQSSPLIVMGDFNASQWAYPMRELMNSADLRDARQSFGLRSTWFFEGRWPGLMLDHLLVSDEWHVANFQNGELNFSDHTPLIIDLQLCETACQHN